MDYSINSKETKTVNLNNAELNELDYLVSKTINRIKQDAKIVETFDIKSSEFIIDIDKTKFKYQEDKEDYQILNNLQLKLNETL
jgi:hypothetical protein|tara:strand:+ start:43 stop:294 length:252 start_codon:yes stop_codon:yes gene_type:complete